MNLCSPLNLLNEEGGRDNDGMNRDAKGIYISNDQLE